MSLRLDHALAVLLLAAPNFLASSQTVSIQVSNLHDHAIVGAVLSTKGNGSTSPPTDVAGKTQIQIPKGLQVGDELALVLVKSKPTNLQFYSPWQGRAIIPSAHGYIGVVLGIIGDKAALENPEVVSSLAAEIDRLNKSSSGEFLELQMNRKLVSTVSGFKIEEIDSSVRKLAGDREKWGIVRNTVVSVAIEDYLKKYPGNSLAK